MHRRRGGWGGGDGKHKRPNLPPPLFPGTAFCAGMSAFGFLFMAVLAGLLRRDYQYLGEWYEPKSAGDHVPPYDAQRAAAVANCWRVAWMYAATGAASVAGMAWHRARGR